MSRTKSKLEYMGYISNEQYNHILKGKVETFKQLVFIVFDHVFSVWGKKREKNPNPIFLLCFLY